MLAICKWFFGILWCVRHQPIQIASAQKVLFSCYVFTYSVTYKDILFLYIYILAQFCTGKVKYL